MTILAVLCCRLNKYYTYLTITAILTLKWGPSGSDMHQGAVAVRGPPDYELEERDRHLCGSGEVALTPGGEGNECHLLNGTINLTAHDGPHPWLHRVERYRQVAAVERNVPVVAEMDECVV
jgi:hypothetical protein